MAKDLLYPEDGVDEQGDPYYTLPDNPDDKLAAGSRGSVAFSEPDQNGLRYPVATPELGSWQPDAAPSPESLNGVNGGTYVPGSEKLAALPGGGYNQAYAADELKSQYGNDPHALQSAIRFQGLQEYKKLIDGGASDSEALRLAAPKLYFNHPAAMNTALKFAGTQNPNGIRSVPVPGGVAILNPNGTIHSVGWDKTPKVVPEKIPPDAKFAVADATDEVKDLNKSLRDINTSVATGKMDEAEAKPMRDKIATQLQAARENRMKLSTNWMNRTGPQAPDSDAKTLTPDSIRADFKAGKISRDAAKKLLKDHGFD